MAATGRADARRVLSAVVTAALTTLGAFAAHAAPIQFFQLSDAELDLHQLDLTYTGASQANSTYGLLTANLQQVLAVGGALPGGFINIHNTALPGDSGWIVRNMPVDPSSGYAGISTMFDLNNQASERVSSMTLSAVLSDQPLPTYTGGSTSLFTLGKQENNAQGAGGGPGDPSERPAPPGSRVDSSVINTNPLAGFELNWQAGHRSIEQDLEQCMPAAVANSLQWLEDTAGLPVPDPYVPGIRDNGCGPGTGRDCSLVGKLDIAMRRPAHQPVASARNFISGKLDYIDDANLEGGLIIKHKERPGVDWLRDSEVSPDGNAKSTEDKTPRSLVQWIIDEIRHGEDVEVRIGWDGGGGHMIDIIGGGEILGVPWISWVHDANQGANGNGTPGDTSDDTTRINGGTNWFDGGVGWSPIVDNRIVAYIGGEFLPGTIDFAASESIPEPGTLALLTLSILALAAGSTAGAQATRPAPRHQE